MIHSYDYADDDGDYRLDQSIWVMWGIPTRKVTWQVKNPRRDAAKMRI